MLGNQIMEETPQGSPRDDHAEYFENHVNNGTYSRLTLSVHGLVPNHRFFITTSGYLGIGSPDLQQ